MASIKIAYLISVHKDPNQVKRMIQALYQGNNTHFFIHIDAKCDQNEFKKKLSCYKQNIHYTPNRYWIQWGGFNQVQYQKELLKTCIESGISFDRVFILTGQDYPLKSNDDINAELTKDSTKEYIIGLNISNIDYPTKIKRKLTIYHFFRDLKIPSKTRKIFSGISRHIMTIIPIRKKPYLIIDKEKWSIYQSSAMMCITYNTAKYVADKLKDHRIIRYFKYSFTPDELVIPTIIFNSPFRTNCMYYKKEEYEGLKTLSAITYFNYGKKIQTFTLNDYEELKNSGKMFARKFETGISDSLMDKLDKEHGI